MTVVVFLIMVAVTVAGITYPLLRREDVPSMAPARVRPSVKKACARCGRTLKDDELFCPGCGMKRGGGGR